MACDSLYAAWLKVHHPYEFYTCMLKLYTEKGNKEKIASISREMKHYLGINVTSGRFGQDNSDWFIDRDNHMISQNLNAIKFISSNVAKQLYKLSAKPYTHFVDLLHDILFTTGINSRQIKVLISLDYFEVFGKSKKLMKLYDEFSEGTYKITKTLRKQTIDKRLEELHKIEDKTDNESIPLWEKLCAEQEYLGRCISSDEKNGRHLYFVESVDDKYGVKVQLYNMARGNTVTVRCPKPVYNAYPLKANQCIFLTNEDCEERQRYTYRDGEKVPIEGVKDFWIKKYRIQGAAA